MKRQGFTMVELAIVLVLIGLLTGGVLVGQSLIHTAKLRAVTRSVEQFEASIGAFKDKYLGLPGDLTEATRYWGTDPGGCPSNAVQTPRVETCNGNGDGHVGNYNYAVPDDIAEAFRAIQQLSNAGLISGQYSGVTGPLSASHAIAGVNAPKAKFSNGGWSYYYIDEIMASGLKTPTANVWEIGSHGDNSGMGDGPVMTQMDAYSIDGKIDDGMPNTGTVRAYFIGISRCVDTADADETYPTTTENENRCSLEFISGF